MEVKKMNELIELKERFEGIVQAEEEFPVDFDQAWQWIGYSSKRNGLRVLTKNFQANFDYMTLKNKLVRNDEFTETQPERKKHAGGRGKIDQYSLSVDCFKSFCMLAQTDKGKQVRQYYIQLEKEFFKQRRKLIAVEHMGIAEARIILDRAFNIELGYTLEHRENLQIFFDLWIWFTGNPDDYLLIETVHRKYLHECQNESGTLSRFNFTRYVRKLFPSIGYGPKKVDGHPYQVFYGIRFQE
jgi:phage anti-repressor protein